MPRAILSVSDKTGLAELARTLVELGWDLIASGGTAAALQEAQLPVTPVEVVTGMPEMLGGRVKTLHPAIHAGILARDQEADLQDLRKHGYAPISMVVCNLYPFEQTIRQQGVTVDQAIEQIDIGGVTLLRAAAKNFARVTVVCDPADYPRIAALLRGAGTIDETTRRELALKAFAHTRDYDTAIHAYLSEALSSPAPAPATDTLPNALSLSLIQTQTLRYGENPHQQAGFYAHRAGDLPLSGQLLGGKELSYNNLLDLDSAWRAVTAFEAPTVVIVKHLSPIGIATNSTIAQAFSPALASDRVSAFGGVIAVNRTVDEAFVAELGDLFIEAIAAPDFTPTAQQALLQSRRNCRLVKMLPEAAPRPWQMRSIRGGFLLQTIDPGDPPEATWRTVTRWKPTAEEMETLRFAWRCVQFVPSNAIVVAVPGATVGVGGGLPSRVDATRLAIEKAGPRARGAVLASDAFFPFPDAVELAAQAGIAAIVQPGGSIRDAEVIAAADEAGIAMVFSGARHFRH
ncbi:MAG: bifunctional phosphoribosylaminoimidazolecarboxamide formyltransferase/IMP cyclohydrolase [Anaerolineae bacterium]